MYTVGDIPRCGVTFYPDKEAVIYEDTRLTYSELDERINRLSNTLLDLGIEKGDHITVLADNCSKYLEIYLGAARIGVVVTPLNVRLGDEELIHIINDSEAKAFFVGDGYEEKLMGIKDKLKGITRWISLDNHLDEFFDYEACLEKSSAIEPSRDKYNIHENDMAVLMYTGGTTGLPKGVMLSHRNIVTSGTQAAFAMGFDYNDSTCYVLPIFHVSFWPIYAIMLAAGKVCINRKPNLDAIFQLIEDEKCTHMNLVPTIYGWMVDYPNIEKYDLSSLRILSYAGSPFPVEVLKKCIKKFGKKFGQGYGATETTGAPVSMLHWDDHFLEGRKSKYLASAGKAAPIARVKIVDENDNTLPANEKGEICCKGIHVMLGYWKNENLTREALKGGWYHTGDIGYIDEEGYIFMTDRMADMIISGGENVYPKEVEDIIYRHGAVKECAVVSSPDDKWGEIVQAVVVIREGESVTEEDIIEHCRKENLAGYKCPKRVAFWEMLPKSVVGKILKKDIKSKFWQGKEKTIS
jgi:acyl-CoA synthetase (AMP-forming)/AMP-acid ligase II